MAGLALPNPIGLAAGFDKDAEVPDAMLKLGFGFVECGSVCPRPQPGNAKPRLFRLMEDEAVINRFGFNSKGVEFAHARLTARAGRPGIVGINLGANKDSEDRTDDYVVALRAGTAGVVRDGQHLFAEHAGPEGVAGWRGAGRSDCAGDGSTRGVGCARIREGRA